MKTLTFKTLVGPWTAAGQTFAGECTVEDPSDELVRFAGSAHAAGVLEVSEGLDVSHVEDDEASLAKLAEAQGEWVEAERDPETGVLVTPGFWTGPWQEGHEAAQALMAGKSVADAFVDVVEGSERS